MHMCAQSCLTLCDSMDYSQARLLCLWDSPWLGGGRGRGELAWEEGAGRVGAIMQKKKVEECYPRWMLTMVVMMFTC